MYTLNHFRQCATELKNQLFHECNDYEDMFVLSSTHDRYAASLMLYALADQPFLRYLLNKSFTNHFARSLVRDLYAVLNEYTVKFTEQENVTKELRVFFNFRDGVTNALVYSHTTFRAATMFKMYEDLYLTYKSGSREKLLGEDEYAGLLLHDVLLDNVFV
jgi:hypothetical protein